MKPKPITIAVYGSSGIKQDSTAARNAELLGKLLAEAGYNICNGGYMGVMEAASRGAKTAGAKVTGVTCSAFSERTPNPYLTEEISTQDLPERISTLMRIADGYIVLDGSIGTLAELFLAWNVIFMEEQKPLILVGNRLRSSVEAVVEHSAVPSDLVGLLTFVDTVEEACETMMETLPPK